MTGFEGSFRISDTVPSGFLTLIPVAWGPRPADRLHPGVMLGGRGFVLCRTSDRAVLGALPRAAIRWPTNLQGSELCFALKVPQDPAAAAQVAAVLARLPADLVRPEVPGPHPAFGVSGSIVPWADAFLTSLEAPPTDPNPWGEE